MNKKQQKRRSEIIKALSDLSRGGWSRSRREDYASLEQELAIIEGRLRLHDPRKPYDPNLNPG